MAHPKSQPLGEIQMGKKLKKFISGLEGTDNDISIKDILSENELLLFEKWVRIFNKMTPFTIVKGIKSVQKEEEMRDEDDAILLAYIKFFEQKLKHLKEGVESYGHLFGQPKSSKKNDEFDGDMYA